jgi:hypothetical protein
MGKEGLVIAAGTARFETRGKEKGLGPKNGAATQAGNSWRTSLTSPAMAAAATMAGLISKVRPVAEPCRPLKLRLLELALI